MALLKPKREIWAPNGLRSKKGNLNPKREIWAKGNLTRASIKSLRQLFCEFAKREIWAPSGPRSKKGNLKAKTGKMPKREFSHNAKDMLSLSN